MSKGILSRSAADSSDDNCQDRESDHFVVVVFVVLVVLVAVVVDKEKEEKTKGIIALFIEV